MVIRTVSSVVDGHNSRVFAAMFHPVQTTEFISGGWDSVVHVWDMRQSNSMRYIKGVHICGEGLDISKSGREVRILQNNLEFLCWYNSFTLHLFKQIISANL